MLRKNTAKGKFNTVSNIVDAALLFSVSGFFFFRHTKEVGGFVTLNSLSTYVKENIERKMSQNLLLLNSYSTLY